MADIKDELPQTEKKWMESKANMLEEMSQLVDLMTLEKGSLNDQIHALNVELESTKVQLSGLESKMQADIEKKHRSTRHELTDLKQKQKKETTMLKEALDATQKELEETRSKLGLLNTMLKKEKNATTQLHQTNCALETKLEHIERKKTELMSSLSKGAQESTKLSSQVSSLLKQCQVLKADNEKLQSSFTAAQHRFKQSQGEVLALKGRLASARKSNKQLQMNCSSLEQVLNALQSRSPTVVKVPTKSRDEVRLTEECRRKDNLLASCTQEIFACNSKNNLLQKELSDLKSQLNKEKRERLSLLSTLKVKETEWEGTCENFKERMASLTAKLESKENHLPNLAQEYTLADLRKSVEGRMRSMDSELKGTRHELHLVKKEVSQKEKSWNSEKTQLEQDMVLLQEELQTNKEEVAVLTRELESTHHEHLKTIESLTGYWESQMREAREDYLRMKEASTRRCTELAKEVWRLKSELEQAQNY